MNYLSSHITVLNFLPPLRIVDIPDIPMLPTNSFYNISDLNGMTSGPDRQYRFGYTFTSNPDTETNRIPD